MYQGHLFYGGKNPGGGGGSGGGVIGFMPCFTRTIYFTNCTGGWAFCGDGETIGCPFDRIVSLELDGFHWLRLVLCPIDEGTPSTS